MPRMGNRAGKIAKTLLVSSLILLIILSSIATWLPGLTSFFASLFPPTTTTEQSQASCPTLSNPINTPGKCSSPSSNPASNTPNFVGANPVPNLSLPKTVLSSLSSLMSDGGVVQDSSQNLTLYNLAVSMRLLGGSKPHDQMVGPGGRMLGPSFWSVQANVSGQMIPLLPTDSNFTLLGTDSGGTRVARTMRVASGAYSGIFEIIYTATPAGPLKWDLLFTPDVIGEYQITFSWQHSTQNPVLQNDAKSFTVAYDSVNYTLNWRDVPRVFDVKPTLSGKEFSLAIDLGIVAGGNQIKIDPTIASNVGTGATAFSFQRKIIYNSQSGYYFAFYHNGITVGYSSSNDGVNWSTQQTMPSGWPGYWDADDSEVAVLSIGQTVFVASGQKAISSCGPGNCSVGAHPYVFWAQGTMSGASINWLPTQFFGGAVPTCASNGSVACTITAGYRYVNIAWSSSNNLVLSYNYYEIHQQDASTCASISDMFEASNLYLNYLPSTGGNNIIGLQGLNGCTGPGYSNPAFADTDHDRSILIPADPNGKVRIVYQYGGLSSTPSIMTTWYDGTSTGVTETLATMPDNDQFSAIADTNYGQHLVYPGSTDGTVAYTYKASIGSLWATTPSLYESAIGSVYAPTITVDYSTNNLYVLALLSHGGPWSVVMKSKTLSQSWSDQLTIVPVTGTGAPPAYLSSASISASATNNAQIAAIWTQQTCPCSVAFASIPIQTVWSPFSTPPLPWDGNGLAPYGQYFSNLGEYVSPSTGMLTIRQTDLSLAGRGINLEITRIFTEPYSFLNCSTSCQTYLYEPYPWAPISNGWQLNYPWMTSTPRPSYLHVSNGQGYQIPSSFWAGASATLENHQGENFRLVRFFNGTIVLYDASGTAYSFGTSPNHALKLITDSTGNNTITFNYSNNLISCISDTLQRPFSFTYSGGFVQKISQLNGSCASPGSTIRSVIYGNNGASLTSVTDPANRVTTYSLGSNPWLISQITYPTGWYDSYTYAQFTLGTQATTFRVSLQQVMASSSSTVRQFAYSYTPGVGDQVIRSTVTSYNGTQIASYTKYAFSFLAYIKNVTDASGNLLSGDEQFFGVNGQIPKDVVLVSDGQGHLGSYTNYYTYDLWGNMIFSRRAINPLSNHESFNAYYNNAEQPGFYTFQDSFSNHQGTTPDNSWNVTGGNWLANNGVYNGTETKGKEDSMFSWSNIAKTDISIQAKIYITRQINSTDARIGLVTHYPGTDVNKWALVIHNSTGGIKLSILDENVAWVVENPCTLVYSRWYTFNFTTRGNAATGWASAPGVGMCTVSGTFPSDTVATATGFGLYAGGYSALFDDVQVTTVSSFITGSTFSNSFMQNGAPGPVGLNTWLATTKPPSQGWNTATNWSPASAWSQAYPSQNYGAPPWGTLTGWPDSNAQWIWGTTNANVSARLDPVWFRRTFNVSTAVTLNVAIATDDTYVVYLDGSTLGIGSNWQQVGSYTSTVGPGYHVLAINATNTGGPAGLLVSVKNTGTGRVIFRSDATTGPVISVLAGSAQLQNGAGTTPIETYYSYYPWGGLSQTRQLYYPRGGPLRIDGVSTGFTWNNAKETTTLSTSNPNDLIILDIYGDSDGAITNVTDNTNLVWKQHFNQWVQYEYYAISPVALSSDVITVAFQSFASTPGLIAYGISGYNFATPFDPSASIPAGYDAATNNPAVTITLSGSNELVLGNFGTNGCGIFTASSGFTPLTEIGGSIAAAAEYEIASGTVTVTGSFAPSCGTAHTVVIADAILPANPTWITTSKTYDGYGNLVQVVDARGNSTSFAYSTKYQSAYLTSQIQTVIPGSTQIISSFGYNFSTGMKVWAQQPNGYGSNKYNTTYTYDILGRQTKVTYPTGDYASYVYNDLGNYVNATNENGLKTQQLYDGLGRLVSTQRILSGGGSTITEDSNIGASSQSTQLFNSNQFANQLVYGGNVRNFNDASDTAIIGVCFVATKSGNLAEADFWLGGSSGLTGSVTAQVYSTTGSIPNYPSAGNGCAGKSSLIATSTTSIDTSTLSTSGAQRVAFSFNSGSTTSGQEYIVAMKATFTNTAYHTMMIGWNGAADSGQAYVDNLYTYPGGALNNPNNDYEQYTCSTASACTAYTLYLGSGASTSKISTIFSSAFPFDVKDIQFRLESVGTPTGNLYAQIYALTGSEPNAVPTGSVLATSIAVPASSVGSSSFNYVDFPVSGGYYLTNPYTDYAIVLDGSQAQMDASNYILASLTSIIGTKNAASMSSGSSTWTASSGISFNFKVSGSTVYYRDVYSKSTNTYNWMNKITTSTDPMGNKATLQYDSLGRTIISTKPDGTYTQEFYNDTSSYARFTDENLNYRCNTYDRLGRLVSVIEQADVKCHTGIVTNYYYDEVGDLLKVTNANQASTLYTYDNFGQLTFTTYADGTFELHSYDSNGNLVSKTDRNNMQTGYSFDSLNRPLSITPSGTANLQDIYTYDQNSNTLQLRNQNSTIAYTYDSRNRMLTENYTVNTGFNITANLSSIIVVAGYSNSSTITLTSVNGFTGMVPLAYSAPSGVTVSFSQPNPTLSAGGTAISTETISTSSTATTGTYTLTVWGNSSGLIRSVSISLKIIGFSLAISPNTVGIKTGNGESFTVTATSQNGYHASSITLSISGLPSGVTTSTPAFNPNPIALNSGSFTTSALTLNVGRTASAGTYSVTITATAGTVVRTTILTLIINSFAVTPTPNPITIAPGAVGSETLLVSPYIGTSDTLPLSIASGLPSCVTSSFNPTTVTLPNGGTSTLTLTVGSACTNGSYTVTVNAIGKKTSQTTTFTLIIGTTSGGSGSPPPPTPSPTISVSYTIRYSYFGEFLSNTTYPDGLMVVYSYDGVGRVTSLAKSGSTGNYASFQYNSDDQPRQVTFGNTVVASYAYTPLLTLSRLTLTNGVGKVLLTLSYTYTKTGAVASITGNSTSTSGTIIRIAEQYGYDPLQRLATSQVVTGVTNTTTTYGLDLVGNVLTQNVNGVTTTYTYNAANNELASSSNPNTNTSFSYDQNGNLKTRTTGTASTSYAWDTSNRLVKVSQNGAMQGTYAYDGRGRRVQSVESATILYAYTGTDTLSERVLGIRTNDYVYIGGLRIANVSGSAVTYFHSDALGSTRLITDSSQNVLFSNSYQPFGQDNGTPGGSETYKFTGKPYSSATGLYYYYHRWYDSSVGRFISPDPRAGDLASPQTQNVYVYVVDNPVSYNDPRGEFLNILIGAIAGAVIGGAVCAWQHGGWSNSCLISIAVGAVAGAVAGATFNPALGLAAEAGLSGLSATVVAGAVSGAVSGAASYLTQGGLATATGQQFHWSAQDFALSVGTGALAGAVGAGVGYGLGQVFRSSESAASSWSKATFNSPEESFAYHFDKHVIRAGLDVTPTEYTQDALFLRDTQWSEGFLWQLRDGSVGWKIDSGVGQKGIYTLGGDIVTFLYG